MSNNELPPDVTPAAVRELYERAMEGTASEYLRAIDRRTSREGQIAAEAKSEVWDEVIDLLRGERC